MRDKNLELAKLHELEALSASVARSLSDAHRSMENMNKSAEESGKVLARWVQAFEIVMECEE
jgi:methyl-accepting chemotaxis protein